MNNQLRSSQDFQIRSLKTPAEIKTFFRLNAAVFRPDEGLDRVAAQRERFLTHDPDFPLYQLRGAFFGDTYVGGYALLERTMCLGPARLRTACINGVVTHPEYRHQGIASALMQDAIHIATNQQYALLFLHGLASFYHQFGYIDVLEDTPRHFVDRKQLPELSSLPYTVRAATSEDAPALLTCYQRHYSFYLGSFAPMRTLHRQEHLLCNWFEVTNDVQPLVVLSAEQELHGYLLLSRRRRKLYAYEVAADTWLATLALLHAHAHLLAAESEPPQELDWPLPPTDPTFYFLAEHLPVRSQLLSFPNGGWMARPAHLLTLLPSLLPLWQKYWQERSRLVDWTGTLMFTVDDQTSFLEVTSSAVHLIAIPSSPPLQINFNSNLFTQLIFGFRPISWALLQSGQQLPVELISVLSILFPLSQAWVAGSDFF
jgi:predicted N-acetyltransferase YhbS